MYFLRSLLSNPEVFTKIPLNDDSCPSLIVYGHALRDNTDELTEYHHREKSWRQQASIQLHCKAVKFAEDTGTADVTAPTHAKS